MVFSDPQQDTANYALDDAGNITAETGNPTAGGEFSYGFTNNRLMSRTPTNPAAGVFSYGYDRFGNQSTQTQVTETEGTKVTTNTYDAASQPAQTTEPDASWVRYGYDGMGRMVSRTDSANKTTLFFREAMTQQITVETDGAGANKVRYLLDSSANPLGKEDLNNSTGRSYYVSDPRGNLTQLLDQGENVRAVFAYDPYGKQKTALTNRTGNWDSRLRFQMAPQDPQTGNYSLGARLLDPNINRFVGADNYVGASANLGLQLDPLTGNRYLYAGANPAGLIDDGHHPNKCPVGGQCTNVSFTPRPGQGDLRIGLFIATPTTLLGTGEGDNRGFTSKTNPGNNRVYLDLHLESGGAFVSAAQSCVTFRVFCGSTKRWSQREVRNTNRIFVRELNDGTLKVRVKAINGIVGAPAIDATFYVNKEGGASFKRDAYPHLEVYRVEGDKVSTVFQDPAGPLRTANLIRRTR